MDLAALVDHRDPEVLAVVQEEQGELVVQEEQDLVVQQVRVVLPALVEVQEGQEGLVEQAVQEHRQLISLL